MKWSEIEFRGHAEKAVPNEFFYQMRIFFRENKFAEAPALQEGDGE